MSKPIGTPRRPAGSAVLCALFVLCWSSGFVGARFGTRDQDVLTVLAWRMVPLAVVLLLVARVRRARAGPGYPRTTRADLLRQVGVGLLSQSGYLLTVYWAIGLGVSTGTTALVDGTQPLLVVALAGPLLGVAVTGRQWLGLVLGLTGVVVVTLADAGSPRTDAPAWAYAVPFAGTLGLVAATLLDRRGGARSRPLHDLTVHCATSGVVFGVAALATGAVTVPAEPRFWAATAWSIVVPTFGGYGLYWLLLDRVGIATVNSLLFLVPPVTTAWGALLFAEPVTPFTVAGLALALAATRLVTGRDRRPEPPRPTAPPVPVGCRRSSTPRASTGGATERGSGCGCTGS
jgi:drug/metabolite transporter (DMT)-like permease